MTLAYHRAHGVDTRIVRIFNTYGPRMRLDDGRALPNFICQALSEQSLTVFGDGSQTRSFCHVSDLIDGIWRLLESDVVEPVNLGNPDEIPIIDFAKEVIAMTKSDSGISYLPLPEDDPQIRQPDITLAKSLLGWSPEVSLAEGLSSTIPYFERALRSRGSESVTFTES